MIKIEKACPVVTRKVDRGRQVLAFAHPSAGDQFVKGTVEVGEHPQDAAARELREESGLLAPSVMTELGSRAIGTGNVVWHFFAWHSSGLPDNWRHEAKDDYGHAFSFFWHPLRTPLNNDWHPIFHQAFEFITLRLLSS